MQIEALEAAGCGRLFSDQASGARSDRPGLLDAMSFARPGDSFVVWKLDRLGRSMKGLVELAHELESRQINLLSLTDGIDTSTAAGRFFFHIMAALAEMERELIRERTASGLASAKRAGRTGGRPSAMTPKKNLAAKKLLQSGSTPKEIADAIGVSVATIYRHLPDLTSI